MNEQNGAAERTLGQLVADATHDLSSIIRNEIALAKAEIGADVKKAGAGAGLFAAAALLVFLALLLLPIAAAYGLVAAGLAPWLSFLVVSGLFLVLGAILAVVGKNSVSKVKGKPERAIKNAQDTIAAIRPKNS
ncbi:MAG: phage holin family protein [Phycicoccus sp.]|nr:phage holin family protein [Phycicoccus sp.]